jgi:methionyl-tRNA formyltransferase
MRFAITATDRYLAVFNALLKAGWEPVRLFTAPTDDRVFATRACIARAHGLKMGIQLSPIKERDLRSLAEEGCDILVVASYQWRIGDWRPHLRYAVNFHPSLLPNFRGPYPLVNGLLGQSTRWGVTCHKVAADFDTGDILAQRAFDVAADEFHERLDLRTQMAAAALAGDVAGNFEALWNAAQPQSEGSYARLFNDADRTLDFNRTVEENMRIVRAMGRLECLATVHGIHVHVTRATGWKESHQIKPGTVVHVHSLANVVACSDGYIALLDWHLFDPNAVTGTDWR